MHVYLYISIVTACPLSPQEGARSRSPQLNFTAAPSPLETTFSITITGSSVDVCVETKTAQAFKVVLRDAFRGRHRQVGEGKHK